MSRVLPLCILVGIELVACGGGPLWNDTLEAGSPPPPPPPSPPYDSGTTLVEASADVEASAAPLLPPIDPVPQNGPTLCSNAGGPSAYLLAENGTLFAFNPSSLETQALGVLDCHTSANAWALTVSSSGLAYALYQDWNLYQIDLSSLACTKTPYVASQLGLTGQQGMTVGTGTASDRIYFYGNVETPTLALSDLTRFLLFQVGATSPSAASFPVSMAMDPYGRLLALASDGALMQLDPATGAIIAEDQTGFDAQGKSSALLSYGSELYFLGADSGTISRYDLATKALFSVGQENDTIVGAGATPCLQSSGATSSDGGSATTSPDAGGDASDAGATGSPWSAGDSWLGTFVCAEGLTQLALVIDSVSGSTIHARFDFDSAGGASLGSVELTGSFDSSTREATFTPGAWASQPTAGWSTVGLEGSVDLSGEEFSGTVTGTGCGAFSVHR